MSLWKKIGLALLVLFAVIGAATVVAYVAITFHLTNVKGIIDTGSRYLHAPEKTAWQESEEWQTLKGAVITDKLAIEKAAQEASVEPRLIVSQLVVEQLRLFTSEREIFKQIFKPLQILGVQSQFSWGVMGLKKNTAEKIENNLRDSSSPYYLGKRYENLLDFTTDDHDTERFNRLTDQKDHYYSYLYTALFLKQIMTQWQKAGFDISDRPEILSTLFNIGFEHSEPNAEPKVGGAEITINGETYSFGELAYAFYISDELIQEFPRK